MTVAALPHRFGVVYHGVHDDRAVVSYQGALHRFRTHHVLDFDPTRKRMSVIVEDEAGEFLLLVKGAETAVLDRCVSGDVDATEQHVVDYALVRDASRTRTLRVPTPPPPRPFKDAEIQGQVKCCTDLVEIHVLCFRRI